MYKQRLLEMMPNTIQLVLLSMMDLLIWLCRQHVFFIYKKLS